MLIAVDTSVLVAAAVAAHPRHASAVATLSTISAGSHRGCIASHALVEVYSVLTKLPLTQPVSPHEARGFVGSVRGFVEVVDCTEGVCLAAIERCQLRGLSSGAVYDALHLIAAEKAKADVVVTFNTRDFERLATENSPRIHESV